MGSYSGKLFKLTLQGNNLTVEYIVTFNNYGYGAWTSVVPVVINNEYGAVVSSYGMDSKLFLNLSNEDPTNGWHYIFDLGTVGTSQWVEW